MASTPEVPDALAEAIDWLVSVEATGKSDDPAFFEWLARDPRHALIWQRLHQLGRQFTGMRGPGGAELLRRMNAAEGRLRQKRRSLRTLAGLGALGLGFCCTGRETAVGQQFYGQAFSDFSTSVGEQRELALADGSLLTLNTRSAVDMDAEGKSGLHLRYGEMALSARSAMRIHGGGYSFSVAGGSDITLTLLHGRCDVQVIAGAVACSTSGADWILAAGDALRLEGGKAQRSVSDLRSTSWRRGLLIAQRDTLGHMITQLGRYRPGYLGCEQTVASLTLSGSFPLRDTDAILDNLCQILPIRQQRLSRYWVRLMPA